MEVLLQTVDEKELIATALAFVRSETSGDHLFFTHPLGHMELHRREESYKAFSFSYFHILMEKSKDGYAGP
jgi:hypothetical protein